MIDILYFVLPSALLKKALHPRLRSHPKGAEGRADGVFASFQAKKSKCLELSKGNRLK
jgi:hypothetical protein